MKNAFVDFFSDIGTSLSNIWTSISSIPENVRSAISGFFDNIRDWFSATWDNIAALPRDIFDFIKGLFIPDDYDLQAQVIRLSNVFLDKFGFGLIPSEQTRGVADVIDSSRLRDAFGEAQEIDDSDFLIGDYLGFDLSGASAVNSSWLKHAALSMRPYIRGFIMLLLFLYNINQTLSFVGVGNISSLGSAVSSHIPDTGSIKSGSAARS